MGTYYYRVANDMRIYIPSAFFDGVLMQSDAVIIFHNEFENCLGVYFTTFKESEEKIMKLRAETEPFESDCHVHGVSVTVAIDSRRRIYIPRRIANNANITPGCDVACVGVGDRFEIWEKSRWDFIQSEMDKIDISSAISYFLSL